MHGIKAGICLSLNQALAITATRVGQLFQLQAHLQHLHAIRQGTNWMTQQRHVLERNLS